MDQDRFPIARDMAAEVLSLPIGPHLSESQVSQVCTAIQQWGRR
jgi:dTDP-4-amino-4,6-dideoxygalactose transaminase